MTEKAEENISPPTHPVPGACRYDEDEVASAIEGNEEEYFQHLKLSKCVDVNKCEPSNHPSRKQPLTRRFHSALINSRVQHMTKNEPDHTVGCDKASTELSLPSKELKSVKSVQSPKKSETQNGTQDRPCIKLCQTTKIMDRRHCTFFKNSKSSSGEDDTVKQEDPEDETDNDWNELNGTEASLKDKRDDDLAAMRCTLKMEMERGTNLGLLKREEKLKKDFPMPPYQCSFETCTSNFSRWDKFMRHLREHNGERPFTCVRCNSKFKHRNDLMSHLKRHIGIKPIKCESCNETFEKRRSLTTHMITKHGVRDQRPRKFNCTECGDAFLSKMAVDRHMRSWHTGYRPKTCESCGATFHTEYDLRDHMRIHSGEKPYKCDKCGYCARTMQLLNRHKKSHLTEKPYTCKECDFTCSHAGSMKRHALKHSGKKPYKCPYCEYRCSDLNNLKKHIRKVKKHQGLKTYPCSHCSYFSTDDGNEYLRHMKQFHFPYLDMRSATATRVCGILIEEADNCETSDIGNNLFDQEADALLRNDSLTQDPLSLDGISQPTSSVLPEWSLKTVEEYSGVSHRCDKGDVLLSSLASHDNHISRHAGAFSSAPFDEDSCMVRPFFNSMEESELRDSCDNTLRTQAKTPGKSVQNAPASQPVIDVSQEYVAVLVNLPSGQKMEVQEGKPGTSVRLTLVVNPF